MNPLFDKQVKFHQSISTKLNPEEEKLKIIKDAVCFNRYSSKTRNFDLPPHSQTLLNTKIHDREQKALLNRTGSIKLGLGKQRLNEGLGIDGNYHNSIESLAQCPSPQTLERKQKKLLQEALREIALLQYKLDQAQCQKEKIKKQVSCKISILQSQLKQLKTENFTLEEKNAKLELTCNILREEKENLRQEIALLKSLKGQEAENHSIDQVSPANDSQKFRLLGRQYEKRVNDLYEQNYKFKNCNTLLEGKVEENQSLIQSLQQMNQMLESRFKSYIKQGSNLRQELRIENERLREENFTLKEEKEMVKSEHQVEILKLEIQVQELQRQIDQNNQQLQDQNNHQDQNEVFHFFSRKQTRVKKLQQIIELLQTALKEQMEETIRLKEKNKKLTKIISLRSL